jgi:esterase/lipase superfamily enzyme
MREVNLSAGRIVQYGHWGRPVLVFPSEGGTAYEYADRGMVHALAPLIEAGRIKLYCVDSRDAETWSARHLPVEERARHHERFEAWIVGEVVPFVRDDTGPDIIVTGSSLGAYHALNLALRHAQLFPQAICLSGNYDVGAWSAWGEHGDATYFNNPVDYVPGLHGGHLDWLRSRLSLVLVCGQGQWEDTTGALVQTRRMAGMLHDKAIPYELDVWGPQWPHDWPSWQAQIVKHLPRFC